MAITLVATTTVGSGGASVVEFTSIPQTGKDLLIVHTLRDARTGSNTDQLAFKFNNEQITNRYKGWWILGSGPAGSPANYSYENSEGNAGYINGASATANTFGSGEMYISEYSKTNKFKSLLTQTISENNASEAAQQIGVNAYNSNSAISSIQIYGANANLVQNSVISLYIIS